MTRTQEGVGIGDAIERIRDELFPPTGEVHALFDSTVLSPITRGGHWPGGDRRARDPQRAGIRARRPPASLRRRSTRRISKLELGGAFLRRREAPARRTAQLREQRAREGARGSLPEHRPRRCRNSERCSDCRLGRGGYLGVEAGPRRLSPTPIASAFRSWSCPLAKEMRPIRCQQLSTQLRATAARMHFTVSVHHNRAAIDEVSFISEVERQHEQLDRVIAWLADALDVPANCGLAAARPGACRDACPALPASLERLEGDHSFPGGARCHRLRGRGRLGSGGSLAGSDPKSRLYWCSWRRSPPVAGRGSTIGGSATARLAEAFRSGLFIALT